MRYAARRDANAGVILDALRKAGFTVMDFSLAGQGIPDAQGYQLSPGDAAIGGMGEGSLRYAAMSDVVGPVTDADILAAIESCRPAGCVIWTDIESTNPERFLNLDAILDEATLA